LFPIISGEEGLDPASASEDEDDDYATIGREQREKSDAEPAARHRRYIPPSSVGFSFYAYGEKVKFQVICTAVKYIQDEGRDEAGQFRASEFERKELGGDADARAFQSGKSGSCERFSQRKDVFGGLGGVDVLWRPFSDGWIVTVSLFNRQECEVADDPKTLRKDRAAKSLFEAELRCILEEGDIGAYPRVDKSLLTHEELELELQYTNRHIYAIGHGAAVDWNVEQGRVTEIRSEFLPAVEVPQVTAEIGSGGEHALGLAHLAAEIEGGGIPETVFEELDQFVAGYSSWVSEQKKISNRLEDDDRETSERITQRMETTLERMRRGVSLLRNDPLAARAFQLANRTMLDQMLRSDQIRGKNREESSYRWRPFQLAFLLMVVESAVHEDDDLRDIVDLIWFPTGGGKTEAYLGLIAFLVVWRRLKYSAAGGGTTVLMRYTLRLLTVQQYLRASRMICALELIRRKNPELGDEPVTVGLWVGQATSPNTYAQAEEEVKKVRDGGRASQKLILVSCPWCGTAFDMPQNYVSQDSNFHFCCTNPECEFGGIDQGRLPCNVVDQALFDRPPTLLLATIDKFARMAWDERVNAFFGGTGDRRPPELVIQDELHLIAGALGSIAGLYEAALDTVLIQRGVHPKYIASTATIRLADQQVQRLYGRKLAIFPPPGLSCDDSYFARTVPLADRPGRLYVGFLAPMLNRQDCLVPLAAALHVAPEAVFREGQEDREDLLEGWWTSVYYHGSLKGIGRTHNAFVTGVRDFVGRLGEELKQAEKDDTTGNTSTPDRDSTEIISRPNACIAQLTSLSSAEENASTFARLEQVRGEDGCLDAVLATNMVSVGLDVSRLALMIINGQPLTTAEYIQASSRVGRSDVPGMVFANYYRDQARSLSHYENFRPYHDSFYRFVEPTSVTPYTYQARSRALHAALVIVIRHTCPDLLANNSAGNFDPTADSVRNVVELLKRRCRGADPDRATETLDHIDRLVDQWVAEVKHCRLSRIQLDYQAPDNDRATNRLLFNHDDRLQGLWPTLQSMRNVEDTALLKTI
jgi:hypothetical protein